MLIDGALLLCLGNIMRRGLKTALESHSRVGLGHALELSLDVWKARVAHTSEIGMLRTLTAFYDQGTNTHAQRVVYLAEATASYLQLSQEEIDLTALAALLHDIGKAGIPKAILQKPESLSEDEWRVMRLHPELGGQMLLLAGGIFARLAPIVVAHHERWDGSGYPMGLQGEQIPLIARIVAVADSYEAMTSHRHYQETLSPSQARTELLRCAGSQYDPQIVIAFLAMLDEQDTPTAEDIPLLPLFIPMQAASPVH